MRTWRDVTFGARGAWVWLPSVGPLVVLAVFIIMLRLSPEAAARDKIGLAMFLAIPFLWGCFYIAQIWNVLFELSIDGDLFIGKLYFGRTVAFRTAAMRSVNFYRLNWITRSMNFLDRQNPGIDIALDNGRRFRISAKMGQFSELAEVLQKMRPA